MNKMNVVAVGLALLLIVLGIVYFPSIAGATGAAYESFRLGLVARGGEWDNPPDVDIVFDGLEIPGEFDLVRVNWRDGILAGNSDVTLVQMDGDALRITQLPDPDFDDAGGSYNNGFLVGLRGYQPSPGRDLLLECEMAASDVFYGTAGCIWQREGTIDQAGEFTQGFTFVGFSYVGRESAIHGHNGVTAQAVSNWWPTAVRVMDVDMTTRHNYAVRLVYGNHRAWRAHVLLDGVEQSVIDIPNLGPLELQLWGDNYLITRDGFGNMQVGFQGGPEKWVRFFSVRVRTIPSE